MKALTILQPYAHLIVIGQKPIENRTWSTNYRGPLLVHAGTKPHAHRIAEIESRYGIVIDQNALQYGGVIGRVELVAVVTTHPSPWFDGPFGFVLESPRALAFRSARGYQGLFNLAG